MFRSLIGTVVFTLKKHTPEILLGVGVVGVFGSTVLACKATLKATEIVDNYHDQKDVIDQAVYLSEHEQGTEYSPKEEQTDRRALVAATTGQFIRLYGPSATLLIGSIGCILGAYRILAKRNVALMAAYKLLEEVFTKYRSRVVKEIGSQADARFYYGEENRETDEERKWIDKDGQEHNLVPVGYNLSGFARSFEPDKPDQMGGWTGSTQWSKVHEYNLDFLTRKMEHFNNMLLIKGFVTVNDVLTELGFAPTEAGMITGWRYKSQRGDGYISFKPRGIDGNWTFGLNGDPIILDFNIDGVIFDPENAKKEMKKLKKI